MIRNPWPILAALGGIAYPLLVYAALPHLPARVLLVPALGLIALRLFGAADVAGRGAAWALLAAGAALLAVGAVAPELAVRLYPVAMSLAGAAAFGLSLLGGPSLVERIARRRSPELPAVAVRYTWRVTLVWCGFLGANAGIAAVTAVWGTLAQWTLWNGLLFYLAAGALLGGEWLLRRRVARCG